MGRYSLKFGSLDQQVRFDEGEPACYTDEWKRSSEALSDEWGMVAASPIISTARDRVWIV